MIDPADVFLRKARESLDGAESEATDGRFNNCANRCYYACYQAAVAALMQAGVRTPGTRGQWSHEYVPAQFAGLLIQRRKLYPSSLRDALARTRAMRQIADYEDKMIPREQAERLVRRAREFVDAVAQRSGGST